LQSSLLAVQACAARCFAVLTFAVVLANLQPAPLTDRHQRDINCVVEVAVMADEQKRGMPHADDLATRGKRWAGLVGNRIMEETGQPREVVAFAMMEAAKARSGAITVNDKSSCLIQMRAELAAADAASAPLPKPVKAQ
jgi:hypothetical protein